MKIIKTTPRLDGTTRMIVELAQGEVLHAFARNAQVLQVDPDAHYSLGEPLQGEVIAGHILAGAARVYWCSVEQKWREG